MAYCNPHITRQCHPEPQTNQAVFHCLGYLGLNIALVISGKCLGEWFAISGADGIFGDVTFVDLDVFFVIFGSLENPIGTHHEDIKKSRCKNTLLRGKETVGS